MDGWFGDHGGGIEDGRPSWSMTVSEEVWIEGRQMLFGGDGGMDVLLVSRY